tara:strand:+ start:193 stop:741 length:549 start_codon:yes stop_codon:yes gene_type:complete
MKTFKKGQTVTRGCGGNASGFNRCELGIMGASADCYNEKTVFEIEGTVKLITFDHSKEVYGAYLLKKDGVNVGYVYNTYLREVVGTVWQKSIETEFPKLFKGEALLKEARKRYKNGDVFISAYSGNELIIRNINSIKLDSDGDVNVDSNGYLFSDGVWATIVPETITKEQAEFERLKLKLNK